MVVIKEQRVDVSVMHNFIHLLYFFCEQMGILASPDKIVRMLIRQLVKSGNFPRLTRLSRDEMLFQLMSSDKIGHLITGIVTETIDQEVRDLTFIEPKLEFLTEMTNLISDPALRRQQQTFLELCKEVHECIPVPVSRLK